MTQAPWTGPGPTPPAPPVSIEQFRQPGRRTGVLLAVLAVLAVAALVAAAVVRFSGAPGAATASPSSKGQPTSSRTPGPRGSVWMSDVRDAQGYWEILEERWSGNRVTLKIRMEVDTGSTPLVFFVLSNGSTGEQWIADDTGVPRPNLHGTRVSAGDRIDGYVQITMPRQQATLIMGSSPRKPISGLIING